MRVSNERNLAFNKQPVEILNIFKILYLLMNEPFDNLSDEVIINHLITVIYERLRVDNISNYLF